MSKHEHTVAPVDYRLNLVLANEDRAKLNDLKKEFGTDAQAVRLAIRAFHRELQK